MEMQAPPSAGGPGTPEFRRSLLERAREASTSPGVYLMKGADGAILYVGKAKNLKNRLATYFQAPPHEVGRTEMLVNRVHHFDVILTETEDEALILECTLIKKHKPKFNVRLKDDKAYPYLKIRTDEEFPRIEWTRRVLRDGARYFGPFPSAWSARQVMELLTETFLLRDCSDNTFAHRTRPCILHQMGRCSAPCVAKIDAKAYAGALGQAVAVLEGRSDRLVKALRAQMDEAAAREEFEEAAECRDQIRNLELVTATQGVLEPGAQTDRDVVGLARGEVEAHAAVLIVRGGKLIAVKHFHLQNADLSVPDGELLAEFLTQYFMAARDEKVGVPAREALIPFEPAGSKAEGELESLLGVNLRTAFDHEGDPVARQLLPQLLKVARANAEHALEQALRRPAGHGLRALEETQEKLQLQRLPQRIECYDISNIQGQDAVASRVVFIEGAPDKSLYRRYKIRTVEGANDFAMMKEVLGRRFQGDGSLPDLVVVDGGKGQLAQAVAILEELSVQGVGVVGLAKARVESDFRATEVKSSMERVFIPGRKNPVPLLPHTAAYKLLTHVRDEAHRFAITYHRLLRSKRSLGHGENK